MLAVSDQDCDNMNNSTQESQSPPNPRNWELLYRTERGSVFLLILTKVLKKCAFHKKIKEKRIQPQKFSSHENKTEVFHFSWGFGGGGFL